MRVQPPDDMNLPSGAVFVASPSGRARRRIQAVADGSAMAAAILLASWLRFEFSPSPENIRGAFVFATFGGLLHVLVALAGGLYGGRWEFGSFEELSRLVSAVFLSTIMLVGATLVSGRIVPLSVPLIASTLALCFSAAVRYLFRWFRERALRPSHDDVERMIVIGAGEGGEQIITALLRTPNGRYLPVAVLDDHPLKRNLRIRGVRVMGGRSDLVEVVERTGATVALLAIPSAGSELIREVEEMAATAGVRLLVLPSVSELYGSTVETSDIRPVTSADLLGRREHDTDLESIAGYLTGRRVLVTGAGGSIGSELCRQIYRFAPAALVMVERDESALHAVQLSIEGRALLDSRNLVVADIRDRPRMNEVFAEHRPEVVFHAAALKHLPLLEMYPVEAVKTNILATEALLEAAADSGVVRFVNISTDKAADPTSVLGYTKRLAERLTAKMAERASGTYLSVRFGNVLGSRGSVLTAFASQIEAGGPVTVTHPDVTRYFMTVEEAVQLVIQAGAVGRDGEALILEMGDPVRIDDVARRLIEGADRPIDIVYTGLRPGEKLHEVLVSAGEVRTPPVRPGISHVRVPPIAIDRLPAGDRDGPALIADLAAACLVDLQASSSSSGSGPGT